MRYVNIPMQGIVAPVEGQIAGDRTGVVIASYRIAHDGWTNAAALHEAHSYGMHWFELGIKAYILTYRPDADAPSIGADATRL